MTIPLLHRCTRMVLLKKQIRRKGQHLRGYRHRAYRRLRMMRQIREELLQKVRQAIEARQKDMVQMQRDQARHEAGRMLAMYQRWLRSWSKSLLSQRRLIGQQEQLERRLDRRLRLLRKQLGRHRKPQQLLDSCFSKLRKSLQRASQLHPTIEGQAHIWQQEAEEVRRYLSQPHENRKVSRKSRSRKMLHGFSDFWETEVIRKKAPRAVPMTTKKLKSSGQIYAVPELDAEQSKPKKKEKKHAVPESETELVEEHLNESTEKLKKRLKHRESDSRIAKPTIEELEQLYAEQVAGRHAGRQSKPKQTQRKSRRRSINRPQMNLKKLLDLDRPSEEVSVKSKEVGKKSATKRDPMDSGPSEGEGTSAKEKAKRNEKQSMLIRKRKESSGLPQKKQTLSNLGPQLKAVKKHPKKRPAADKPSKLNVRRQKLADSRIAEKSEQENALTKEKIAENNQDPFTPKRDNKQIIAGDLFAMGTENQNFNNLEATDSEISMHNMFMIDKQATEIEAKPVSRKSAVSVKRRKSNSQSAKRKKVNAEVKTIEITPMDSFMPSKLKLQRPEEPGPEGNAPKYLEEDNNERTGYSFHLKDLNSDPRFSGLQRLLKDVIEQNSVLDGVRDVHALMSVVGKHNMWNNLAGLHKELQATGIDKSDIVELLSKKYLDYLTAIVNEHVKNPTAGLRSASTSKYKIRIIDVPAEIAQNIGWLSEHTKGPQDFEESPSQPSLYEMGNASGVMDRDLLKKLIADELQMERDLREERRRKLFSGTSGRFTSTSSMSLGEIEPNEQKNLETVEVRYSVRSIRNMLETYTQHFQSLAKSPVLLALEKERSITEAKLKAMRAKSLATRPQTYTGKRRRFAKKKKDLRTAQQLFYSPRQTCRVKHLNDSDDCECSSVCSDETLVDVWPRVYEKCPRCGVKVELPSPTPPGSVRSLSQSSIEACAKNELMLSTVADICIHCGYIHDKYQACPLLPIWPDPLKHLRRVEEAAKANNLLEPPQEKKPEVLLCCSPCGILKKATRYADR
ncbi:uncharacterized protein LOC111078303 [Drosophila obscura]|uniref:uncharacterized protein LOC111078303 n=1 Tax=Drosophila obscura TaxID=7282 RepID=UPI001BB18EA0|nr:uncharacterized protein LOC111078303 [Drosophila obscura]